MYTDTSRMHGGGSGVTWPGVSWPHLPILCFANIYMGSNFMRIRNTCFCSVRVWQHSNTAAATLLHLLLLHTTVVAVYPCRPNLPSLQLFSSNVASRSKWCDRSLDSRCHHTPFLGLFPATGSSCVDTLG
jgi:hypothetical protein